jgi:hypothetical protein
MGLAKKRGQSGPSKPAIVRNGTSLATSAKRASVLPFAGVFMCHDGEQKINFLIKN